MSPSHRALWLFIFAPLGLMCSSTGAIDDAGTEASSHQPDVFVVEANAADGADEDGPPMCGPSVEYASDPMNCGACGHSCLGGPCVASMCQPVTSTNSEQGPSQIVATSTGAYWANAGTNPAYGTTDGNLRYWANASTTIKTIATVPTGPEALAVGPSDIFFATEGDYGSNHHPLGNGELLDCPVGGCAAAPTVIRGAIDGDAAAFPNPLIAQNDTEYYLYQGDGSVWSTDLGGSGMWKFVTNAMNSWGGMSVDATNLYLWGGAMAIQPIAGGQVTNVTLPHHVQISSATVFASELLMLGLDYDTYSDTLYYCSLPCTTGVTPLPIYGSDGGTTSYQFQGGGLVASGTAIYWEDSTSATTDSGGILTRLMTCNPYSCAPHAIITLTTEQSQNCVEQLIAVSAAAVYWICSNGGANNNVSRLAL